MQRYTRRSPTAQDRPCQQSRALSSVAAQGDLLNPPAHQVYKRYDARSKDNASRKPFRYRCVEPSLRGVDASPNSPHPHPHLDVSVRNETRSNRAHTEQCRPATSKIRQATYPLQEDHASTRFGGNAERERAVLYLLMLPSGQCAPNMHGMHTPPPLLLHAPHPPTAPAPPPKQAQWAHQAGRAGRTTTLRTTSCTRSSYQSRDIRITKSRWNTILMESPTPGPHEE